MKLFAAAACLCMLLAGAALPAASPEPVSRTHAHTVLKQVLSQRSFQRARADSWQTVLQRRVSEWIRDLWDSTFGRRIGTRTAAQGLAILLALAALAVLVAWLVRLASRERRARPLTIGSIDAPRLPGHILGQQAAALIRGGNLREGARLAYRAALSRLEEEGALRGDDARTPRESLRLLPSGHRRRPPFARLTSIFEGVCYGRRGDDASAGTAILDTLHELECLSFDRAK